MNTLLQRARRVSEGIVLAALAATLGAAPAIRAPERVVAMLARDGTVSDCAKDAGETARQYAAYAFAFRFLTLYGGEEMVVAEATDGCLAAGQSTRIALFERWRSDYRPVLASMTMPGYAREDRDGTVTLPNHELMQTIFESTYVWNGEHYVFSDERSHVYDVSLGVRRPSIVHVRFARGAFGAKLSGTTAANFGQDYAFNARAGQRVTVELGAYAGSPPDIALSFDGRILGEVSRRAYRGVLPATGTYTLSVDGPNIADDADLAPYAVRLEIR